MTEFNPFQFPYEVDPQYSKKVTYFSMEFGIHQDLKIYSGGLGYLAGSHLRSAFSLRQHFMGVGILWKFGYYDQIRKSDQSMDVLYMERDYSFLVDTGIQFKIYIHEAAVTVKAWYLPPEVFNTAPLFLLSTDLEENDDVSRSIVHRLYDSNLSTKIAQYILLGRGGSKLMEIIGFNPDVTHLNEPHSLPAAFYLYEKLKDKEALKKCLSFTTHTPVPAGNEQIDIHLLNKMSYFGKLSLDEVRELTSTEDDTLNLTLSTLRLCGKANGVSKRHGEVARAMWSAYDDKAEIDHITNAQNFEFWGDKKLWEALNSGDDDALIQRKKELKKALFKVVADQTGKHFDPNILTIVWARRFAGYKRADLMLRDWDAFEKLIRDQERPVQIIWSGKPYPTDGYAIDIFNWLVYLSRERKNMTVLTGYEMNLSRLLKEGSDLWLNTPVVTQEASGTSGMTASMNGSINFSTWDGWIPEYSKHNVNSFIIPEADHTAPWDRINQEDRDNLYKILLGEILPMYYDYPDKWLEIMKNSMRDVVPAFGSNRMAHEYYTKLYDVI